MRVRYTPRARADLETIFSYLDSRNPVAAQSVKREIERSAAALALLNVVGLSSLADRLEWSTMQGFNLDGLLALWHPADTN